MERGIPPEVSQQPPKEDRTGLYIGIALVVTIVVIGVIVMVYFALQFASLPGLTEPFTPAKSVHHIDFFLVTKKDSLLQVRFSLMSEDIGFISTDGNVQFALYDERTNITLYETEFTIKKSDFKLYDEVLGFPTLGYQWSIPLSDVEKCINYGIGKLKFTASDGTSCSDTDEYVALPQYTEEEIEQKFEDEYTTSATTVNKSLTAEDFEITVVKMGMFSKYVHAYEYFERTFRVDLKVKNTGNWTKTFDPYDSTLTTTEGLQYGKSLHGTLRVREDIAGGETKEGYLLFDEVPETANISKIVISKIYIFDLEEDETYTLMEMYENMYIQSAVTVQQTITNGDFSITLVRVGHFTHLEYDTWGDEVTQFRIDLRVTSITSQPEYILESDIVIIDNLGNQYDYEYGTLDLVEIYPGVTREGYGLFPALDENANNITVTITDTAYPQDIVYEFSVNL